MFWNIRIIDDGKYGPHWQPTMTEEMEIAAGGTQPFRLRRDEERGGLCVLMQGLVYKAPSGRLMAYPVIAEDWREVAFIPFKSEATPDPNARHSAHCEALFGFFQAGAPAYPDVGQKKAGAGHE